MDSTEALLEALDDLLVELDQTGLSTMPGDIYSGLRSACEHARAVKRAHETNKANEGGLL